MRIELSTFGSLCHHYRFGCGHRSLPVTTLLIQPPAHWCWSPLVVNTRRPSVLPHMRVVTGNDPVVSHRLTCHLTHNHVHISGCVLGFEPARDICPFGCGKLAPNHNARLCVLQTCQLHVTSVQTAQMKFVSHTLLKCNSPITAFTFLLAHASIFTSSSYTYISYTMLAPTHHCQPRRFLSRHCECRVPAQTRRSVLIEVVTSPISARATLVVAYTCMSGVAVRRL